MKKFISLIFVSFFLISTLVSCGNWNSYRSNATNKDNSKEISNKNESEDENKTAIIAFLPTWSDFSDVLRKGLGSFDSLEDYKNSAESTIEYTIYKGNICITVTCQDKSPYRVLSFNYFSMTGPGTTYGASDLIATMMALYDTLLGNIPGVSDFSTFFKDKMYIDSTKDYTRVYKGTIDGVYYNVSITYNEYTEYCGITAYISVDPDFYVSSNQLKTNTDSNTSSKTNTNNTPNSTNETKKTTSSETTSSKQGNTASKDESTKTDYLVNVRVEELYVRSGPGTNYPSIASLYKNQQVSVTEITNGNGSNIGWGKISSPEGWISLDYVDEVKSQTGTNSLSNDNKSGTPSTTVPNTNQNKGSSGNNPTTPTIQQPSTKPGHTHSFVNHTGQNPTCTKSGWYDYTTCSCGYSDYQEIPALGHEYALEEYKEPNCEEAGYYYYKCSRCEDSYKNPVSALGHNYLAASCSKPKTCERCGKTVGTTLPHAMYNTTCRDCGYSDFSSVAFHSNSFSSESWYCTGNEIETIETIYLKNGEAEINITSDGECTLSLLDHHYTLYLKQDFSYKPNFYLYSKNDELEGTLQFNPNNSKCCYVSFSDYGMPQIFLSFKIS
ncbi:MAG: SH3 domain-containing protein [Clostridia bacterium]|nr:SH3 domain-containing protein [Clostridia bacterium]